MGLTAIVLLMLSLVAFASSSVSLTVDDKDNEVKAELRIVCGSGCSLTCGGSPVPVSPGDQIDVEIEAKNEALSVNKGGNNINIIGPVDKVEKNGVTVCSNEDLELNMVFSSFSGDFELKSEPDDGERLVHLEVDGNTVFNNPTDAEIEVNVDLSCDFDVGLGPSHLYFNGCGEVYVDGDPVPEAPLVMVPVLVALIVMAAVAYRRRLIAVGPAL